MLGSNEVSFLSDGTNSTFRCMFKEPVEILPNTNYTASTTLKVVFSLSIYVEDKRAFQERVFPQTVR